MSRAKHSHTTISERTKAELDGAENLYRLHKPFTLGNAIAEHRERQCLGPFAQELFDQIVETHLGDWLNIPMADLDEIKVKARVTRLLIRKQADTARWLWQTVNVLRKFSALRHPQLGIDATDWPPPSLGSKRGVR